jgi:hypothetical protein
VYSVAAAWHSKAFPTRLESFDSVFGSEIKTDVIAFDKDARQWCGWGGQIAPLIERLLFGGSRVAVAMKWDKKTEEKEKRRLGSERFGPSLGGHERLIIPMWPKIPAGDDVRVNRKGLVRGNWRSA